MNHDTDTEVGTEEINEKEIYWPDWPSFRTSGCKIIPDTEPLIIIYHSRIDSCVINEVAR